MRSRPCTSSMFIPIPLRVFSPPCEGGVRGGGPGGTRAWYAVPGRLDPAELPPRPRVLVMPCSPPLTPPFARGGKGSLARAVIRSRATKTRVSKPSLEHGQPQLFTGPGRGWAGEKCAWHQYRQSGTMNWLFGTFSRLVLGARMARLAPGWNGYGINGPSPPLPCEGTSICLVDALASTAPRLRFRPSPSEGRTASPGSCGLAARDRVEIAHASPAHRCRAGHARATSESPGPRRNRLPPHL